MKTYIYANSRIIAQHTGDHEADRYFYLHDRLGSIRQIIDTSGDVKNRYTYDPFGEEFSSEIEEDQNLDNVFKFTGQYFDSEIDQYYLRARQYDPHIARFTARDPIYGKFQEPLTLHTYLYCLNDPVNNADPTGEIGIGIAYRTAAWNIIQSSVLNASLTYLRGGTLEDIGWAAASGFAGGLFGTATTAWLGSAGVFGQMPLFQNMIGTGLGSAFASGMQNWSERDKARFYTDVGTSFILGGIFGGFSGDEFSSIMQGISYDITYLGGAYALSELWDEFYETLDEMRKNENEEE